MRKPAAEAALPFGDGQWWGSPEPSGLAAATVRALQVPGWPERVSQELAPELSRPAVSPGAAWVL